MILIVGATSHPGRILVPLLLEKGYPVRALTRDPQKARPLQELGAEVVQGDLRQPETIWKACQGASMVVSSVCAPINHGDNNIHTVDDWGVRLLVYEAMAAEVDHFVLVSGYGVCADHPIDFFRAKHSSEAYLMESGLSYTILRPTAFMDVWGAMVGDPVAAGKRVMLLGDGKHPVNFIAAADVARFILLALEDPRLRGQVVTLGGPENMTLDEVAALYGRLSGRPVRKAYLPAGLLKVMSRVLWPISEGPARLMAMGYEMIHTDWQVDMHPILQRFPVHLTRMEEYARESLEAARNAATQATPLPKMGPA